MSWIKRNLFFVIGSVVALILMGLAGWFLYSKWNQNNQTLTALNADFEELKRLNSQNPHPGNKEINNIKLAQEQRDHLRDIVKKARGHFEPIPRVPDLPKITDRDFSASLSRTIDQLQRDATNSSVTLPANYNFSFEAQKSKISFAAGSLDKLAIQLGEVKTICEVLFQAKVNSLNNLRRERVSLDDSTGLQTDYLYEKTVTNELAVLTPYEVTFTCFSAELAGVLAGLANAPYGLVPKSLNVEAAPAPPPPDPTVATTTIIIQQPTATPTPTPETSSGGMSAAMASRYGLNRGAMGGVPERRAAAPQPQQVVMAPQAPVKSGPNTVLDERQLKVTMNLIVVKLLPPK
jgi:hypothetical protein